jgi:hypothetical protein
MQHTIESLLVALLVALNPSETESPTFTPEGSQEAGPARAGAPPAPLKMESESCQRYADPAARRNCLIRTGRALSGSAEGEETKEFPAQTVWVTPDDPGMPFRFRLPSTIR